MRPAAGTSMPRGFQVAMTAWTSSREIAGFLPPQLQPIPGAAGSRGAHVQADPALALADLEDRARQVARWLCQIATDAGLSGMETLLRSS